MSVPGFVSVIIPALNAEATIGDQLEALCGQDYDGEWETIVADNGSGDRTRDVVSRFIGVLPGLKLIDASEIRGAGPARNAAARIARGDLLCFCDADDIVYPGWLSALVEASHSWDIIAGELDVKSLNDPSIRQWSPTPVAARGTETVPWAGSNNMAMKAKVFADLGGFDPAYLKAQDVELSKRAIAAGYDIGFCRQARVAYRYRVTLRGIAQQGYRTGRAGAQACRAGTRKPRSVRTTMKDWLWIVTRMPFVLSKSRRGMWIRRVCEGAGRITGSVRYRQRFL